MKISDPELLGILIIKDKANLYLHAEVEALKAEIDALRAKIAELEDSPKDGG